MQQYKDESFKGEIERLKKTRNELWKQLQELDEKIMKKEMIYRKNEHMFYFLKGVCSYCQSQLSEDDIMCRTIYCKECRDADSVLEWNCVLVE